MDSTKFHFIRTYPQCWIYVFSRDLDPSLISVFLMIYRMVDIALIGVNFGPLPYQMKIPMDVGITSVLCACFLSLPLDQMVRIV